MSDKNPKNYTKLTMDDVEQAVRFWRSKDFNVIPFNTHVKMPNVDEWAKFQPPNKIPDEQYDEWFRLGTYNQGLAVCCGQVRDGLYGVGVDCDNGLGITLVLQALGYKTLAEASKHVIVVQHKDSKDRAHFIFFSKEELPTQVKYVPPNTTQDESMEPKSMDQTPVVEIKSKGQVLIVPPSMHKDGYPYEIIRGSTKEPEIVEDVKNKFRKAFRNYNIPYCNNGVTIDNTTGTKIGLNKEGKVPAELLFDPDYTVSKGKRNDELHRIAVTMIFKCQTFWDEYKIRQAFEEWNFNHCRPPLDRKETNAIWKSAMKYVAQINEERKAERFRYQEQLKRQAEQDDFFASEQRKREQIKPLSIVELAGLNEEGKMHYAAGQVTSIGPLYKRIRSATKKCDTCGRSKIEIYPYPLMKKDYSSYGGSCRYTFDGDCDGIVIKTPGYVSAINIEVSDNNTLQDTDKMRYILFEDYTKDVGIGENATLLGIIKMETPTKNGPTFSFDYALSIKYESREQEELSKLDVAAIRLLRKKFSDDNELMDIFVKKMTACHIIGHENIKEGILYMVTNAKPDKPEMKQRLHGILISPPALAKTAFLRYATTLMFKATFETSQTSTGLSLFAMVEKDGDMRVIRLGPIARSLFASVDEFNRTGNSDQEKYLGAMQEGFFTSNKFGKGTKVVCPVTILASINPPVGAKALPNGKIDLNAMNIIPAVMDRFDFRWYIMPMNEDDFDNLIDKKMEFVDRPAPDYSIFISKWIRYAKQRYNPNLSDIAREILKLAVKDLRKQNKELSPRVIETLANTAKARARFLLKDTVDESDAKAVIEFYNKMIQGYSASYVEARNIVDIGVEICYDILTEIIADVTIAYRFDDLLKEACNRNKHLAKYIKSGIAEDKYFDRSENKRARNIYERLIENYKSDIEFPCLKPVILQVSIEKAKNKAKSYLTEISERSDSKQDDLSTKMPLSDQLTYLTNISGVGVNEKSENENSDLSTKKVENELGLPSEGRSDRSDSQIDEKSTKTESERYQFESNNLSDRTLEESDIVYKRIRDRRNKKYFTVSAKNTKESNHKYNCPNSNCDYSDANPSRITKHVEDIHGNGGLD